MARLSKTPGVELYRFQRGDTQLAYFSHGTLLKKVREGGEWGVWKRDEAWKIGTIVEIRQALVFEGWVIVREMGVQRGI